MRPLAKPMLAIVTVLLGLGTAAAVAQPGPGPGGGYGWGPGGGPMMQGNPQQRLEMMQQRHKQRMQQLEQQLNLRSDQRGAWQAFVDAQNTWHQSMRSHWQGMEAGGTTPEHFNRWRKT